MCQPFCTRREAKENVSKYRQPPPKAIVAQYGDAVAMLNWIPCKKPQNRAARIVKVSPSDASAAPLLLRLGWLSVDRLVHRETSTMVYKSPSQLAPYSLCLIFSRLSDAQNLLLWNTKCDLVIPRMKTAYGQNSFAFRGVDTGNKLHSDITLALSIQSFKAKLKWLNDNWKYSRKGILHIYRFRQLL